MILKIKVIESEKKLSEIKTLLEKVRNRFFSLFFLSISIETMAIFHWRSKPDFDEFIHALAYRKQSQHFHYNLSLFCDNAAFKIPI